MIDRFPSATLTRSRRDRELNEVADGTAVDLLVIGGGITGAGVALDAASRGLRVVLVEKHDLAFGTSRWSSKLIHGGLRYLASGQLGLARESAVERGILMSRTAPHLVRAVPQVVPLHESVSAGRAAVVRSGFLAGDSLRRLAGSSSDLLPTSGRISSASVAHRVPTIRRGGLRGGVLAWDGRLVDDARLVIAVARTAALYGARILTRVSAHEVQGGSARLVDEFTGRSFDVRPRATINAAGVWAGEVDPSIELRPSRGTHLIFDAASFGGLACVLTIPVPGQVNRFVFALPAPSNRVYVGLTDEPVGGAIPDVPSASESEIDFLLGVLDTVLGVPLTRADVLGTFSGLRPLLDAGGGSTADLSRRHAVLTSDSGLVSVVGGKLTTYRRMAQDAVDSASATRGLLAGPCRTPSIPLVGAASRSALGRLRAPYSLIARYGTEAELIVASAETDTDALEPVADGIDVCRAELEFSVRYEAAYTVDDLLDRRTRIGLVKSDRDRAVDAAERALAAT